MSFGSAENAARSSDKVQNSRPFLPKLGSGDVGRSFCHRKLPERGGAILRGESSGRRGAWHDGGECNSGEEERNRLPRPQRECREILHSTPTEKTCRQICVSNDEGESLAESAASARLNPCCTPGGLTRSILMRWKQHNTCSFRRICSLLRLNQPPGRDDGYEPLRAVAHHDYRPRSTPFNDGHHSSSIIGGPAGAVSVFCWRCSSLGPRPPPHAEPPPFVGTTAPMPRPGPGRGGEGRVPPAAARPTADSAWGARRFYSLAGDAVVVPEPPRPQICRSISAPGTAAPSDQNCILRVAPCSPPSAALLPVCRPAPPAGVPHLP